MTPLIGISGRRLLAAQLQGVPTPMLDAGIDVHFSEYADHVASAGAVPVQLTRSAEPGELVAHLHGLLLSGGSDIDPRRYGATPGPGQASYEPERDEFEMRLVEAAIDRGIPVLGICRGLQIINVLAGGTLVADLPADVGEGHSSYAYPRHLRTHRVHFDAGSRLAGLYGETLAVNSFHHQSADRIGDGLIVSARADDGVVEGIEHQTHDVIGVQWHPEMLQGTEPCFDWLYRKAKEHL